MLSIDGVEMVDVREAAELVGRSPETVRRWAWSRRVDSVKHGNKLLFRRDDVLRLARGDERSPTGRSLSEWAAQVRSAHADAPAPGRARPRSGRSSRDLVLEDRAAREEGPKHARR